MLKKRIKIIPCVFLFLRKENKILLSRRFNTGHEDGKYSLVSGHLERGEVLEEALIREAKEELSISLKKKDLSLIYVLSREMAEGGRIDFVFTANNWRNKIKNNEPNKCDDLKWFDIKKMPPNIIPYTKVMIEGILSNKNYHSLKQNNLLRR